MNDGCDGSHIYPDQLVDKKRNTKNSRERFLDNLESIFDNSEK